VIVFEFSAATLMLDNRPERHPDTLSTCSVKYLTAKSKVKMMTLVSVVWKIWKTAAEDERNGGGLTINLQYLDVTLSNSSVSG